VNIYFYSLKELIHLTPHAQVMTFGQISGV